MAEIVKGDFRVIDEPEPETSLMWLLRDIAEEIIKATDSGTLEDLLQAFADAVNLLDRYRTLCGEAYHLVAEVNRIFWPEGESQ
jgi:hypothetical protein